VKTIQAE